MDYRADGLTHRHTHYIACDIQIENDNRQLIVPAHGNRRGVHNSQALRKHLKVRDIGVANGIGKLERIFVLNAVNTRAFGDNIGLDLESS